MADTGGRGGASRGGAGGRPGFGACAWLGLWLGLGVLGASGADLGEAEGRFRVGDYEGCARLAAGEMATGVWDERWAGLKVRAALALGDADGAVAAARSALRRFPFSLALRLLAYEADRAAGRDAEAAAGLDAIERLIRVAPERFTAPEDRLDLGRYFLLRGADARKVLDQFYDPVTRDRPDLLEGHLATAELALSKRDDDLAASTLAKAPAAPAAADPRYHVLLARAYSDGDRGRSDREVAEALKINPRQVDALLLRADHLIDAEREAEAEGALAKALAVNPGESRAWAYRAVLAHLRGAAAAEAEARRNASAVRPSDPGPGHLFGRKLSQKYRFAEGAEAQRRALALDPDDPRAKVQLCQDLLRLGDEADGWRLADEAFAADPYNVLAYNLVTLRDRLAGFRTLSAEGLVVRMDPREADLYGARVVALLSRARRTLADRYGSMPADPVVVEVFPRRQEFAVRTFGLPGAGGFLGVCFGRVVTALSPAAQGEHPSNWEAVLWHEFAHAVTLHKTRNRMPRWLSEGISVYEEGRADPAWRAAREPRYRAMFLSDALTPLSRLSGAFLTPESPLHLQFAYEESALAVEFLTGRLGPAGLNGLLDDLGGGDLLNEALPRRASMTLEELDTQFARFARERAGRIAPGATWEEPDLPADADSAALAAWLATRPRSFWGLRRLGARLIAEGNLAGAKKALEAFKGLDPDYVGPDNAYELLAAVARLSLDPKAERRRLGEWALKDGDAAAANRQLAELDEAAGDWPALAADARRGLAVNPLTPAPYRALAHASERLGDRDGAIGAYRALLLLEPNDPVESHYRLARLLRDGGSPAEARREVLKSLEDAPRFLDAYRLLLELTPHAGAAK